MQYVFGPLPSRRLGRSVGISPIPDHTCNFACTYCQLGRTKHMTNTPQPFVPAETILDEVDQFLASGVPFDVLSIVGEGEPTLSSELEPLIDGLHSRTDKPVAVITNGALLTLESVQKALMKADIVMPSLDAIDPTMFRRLNRPHGFIDYTTIYEALIHFSQSYEGQLWLEIMLVKDVNDSQRDIERFAELLRPIRYDRLYLNTPVRPPAESHIEPVSQEVMQFAAKTLQGIVIDQLTDGDFASAEKDPYEAIRDICRRHPMNQHEINAFLKARGVENTEKIFTCLAADPEVEMIDYKGLHTYRMHKPKPLA